jgi:predicted glycoside hydrolase/deacetylase ChbG (UPF0249 family)
VSTASRLGFEKEERVAVIHVEDMSLCRTGDEGAVLALEGAATCGSVMVPCPAFPEMVAVARSRPDLDLGVHLTLNAEYETCRWGPLRDDVPGLVSPDGGMWRSLKETVLNASPEEVERELRAQIDRALESGIDVTHLDAHMGTALNPKFVEVYAGLALDYQLPAFIPRIDMAQLESRGLRERYEPYARLIDRLEREGFPIFDQFDGESLSFEPGEGARHNARRVDSLRPGLSFLILHAARGEPELESISPRWRQRDEEHRIYSDGTMERILDRAGIRRIGMRPLRDLLRGRSKRPGADNPRGS